MPVIVTGNVGAVSRNSKPTIRELPSLRETWLTDKAVWIKKGVEFL